MTTVQGTTSSNLIDSLNGTSEKKSSTSETQDRFLKLLVTQMQNQDPLNPMDNAEVTSQMAQLSTVTGIEKLNDTLLSISSSFMASQSLQAASMIGHSVLTSGTSLALSNGVAGGGVELRQPVDQLIVTVKDAAGTAIHTVDLGPQPAGVTTFLWDGLKDDGTAAADGTYTFEVRARQGGNDIPVERLATGNVTSVSLAAGGLKLNVAGLGEVELSQVKRIY